MKVLIVGLGLIGASLAKAIKRPNMTIYGWDHLVESRDFAKTHRIVDELSDDFGEMDIIILSVPIQTTLEYLKKLAKIELKDSVIVTDTGSTKEKIFQLAEDLPFTFIGGHPMAGSHKSGVKAVNQNLFEEAYYILTPKVEDQSVNVLQEILTPTRAKIIITDPASHDEIVAVLSHLPHIVAAGLVKMSDQLAEDYPRASQLAAGGFRDITRIASSDPRMWTDILLTNRQTLLTLLKKWQEEIEKIQQYLVEEDQNAIYDFFNQAKYSRDRLPHKKQGAIPAFYDLYVDIPDIAGAIAQITTIISTAGISITNLKIQETREDIYGVLELSFKNQVDLLQGQKLIAAENFCCRVRS
ncbi:prephenate dehydrogenase [Enterococcus sp. AZ103]|uniref:prephenate dehydrogenase n=1 Tax=Enterococcus sp. AZ103 TaxID=2774628 RepID=UPI003F2559A7